jgi:hypothetical protein
VKPCTKTTAFSSPPCVPAANSSTTNPKAL